MQVPIALKIPVALKRFRLGKAVNWLALTVLTVIIIGFGWLHISPDYGVYLVRSESMKPSLNMGDIVITRLVDSTAGGGVKPGMIITFEHDKKTLTHRVLSVEGDMVATKGDAMEEADPWLVALSDIKGAYFYKIPYVGYVSSFVGTKLGWFLLIIFPAMLLVFLFIKEIMKEALKKDEMEGDSFKEPTVGRHVETANDTGVCVVPAGAVPGDTPSSSAAHDIPAPMLRLGPTVSEILAEATEPPVKESSTEFENLPEPAAQTEPITQAWTVEPGEALATADEIGKSAMEYIHVSMSALEEWLTTLGKTAYATVGPPQVPTGASPRFTHDAEAISKLVEQSVKGSTRAFQERLNSLEVTGQIGKQPLECQPSLEERQHAV